MKNLEKTSVEARITSEPSSPAEPMMRRMPPSPVTQPQAQTVVKRPLVVETGDEVSLKWCMKCKHFIGRFEINSGDLKSI